MNNDHAETPMRIERLKKCVAENKQRDYGNEQVHRDHQGQVLALDLAVPPAGTNEEPDPWPFLKVGSVLPNTGEPVWLSAGAHILSELCVGRGSFGLCRPLTGFVHDAPSNDDPADACSCRRADPFRSPTQYADTLAYSSSVPAGYLVSQSCHYRLLA